jgi:ribonuclease HI
VKDDIPYRRVNAYTAGAVQGGVEAVAVEIRCGRGERLVVSNVYAPPPRAGQPDGCSPEVLEVSSHHIFGGDFNGHSPLWDNLQPSDERGEALEEWVAGQGLAVLNDGSATRVNRATGGWSSPDVSLVSLRLEGRTEWKCLQVLGSDHVPILCEMDLETRTLAEDEPRLVWTWAGCTDPTAYSQAVDREIVAARDTTEGWSLTEKSDFLRATILEAAKAHVGMVRIKGPGREHMTPEVLAATRRRNNLGRDLARNRVAWVEACIEARSLSSVSRQVWWEAFLESLEEHSGSSRTWGVTRRLLGAGPSAARRNEVLVHEGREYHSSLRKADAFVGQYASVSRHRLSQGERRKVRAVRRRLTKDRRRQGPGSRECTEFSLCELEAALEASKTRGAAGPDGLAPRFLKWLGPEARTFVLGLLNQSWSECRCPQAWRCAEIIPIPKAGKPAGMIDSYRPISLTSCLGKLLERMVANRLQHLAESKGLWTEDQAGFRGQRSAEDQILRITQSVSDGLQARPSRRTVLALLDFSKAYDTVWRADLMDCLLRAGIPVHYVRWLQGFLTGRRAWVSISGSKSRVREFREGLPQGSVLAPLLFLFVIDGLRKRLPSDLGVSMYADDLAIWASDPDIDRAARLVEEGVRVVERWARAKKLRLNLSKCEVSHFTLDPGESKYEPEVTVEGVTLKVNPTPVFLGVMYDRQLSFAPQANRVAAEMRRGAGVLGAMSGSGWGWRADSLRRVYLAATLSSAMWGGAGWLPWLKPTNMEILDRAQNACLRRITGCHADAPLEGLRLEAGIPSVACRAARDTAVALERSLRLQESNPRRQIAEKVVRHRTSRSSWRVEAGRLCNEAKTNRHPKMPFAPPTSPPWEWGWGIGGVHLSVGAGVTKESPVEVLRAAAVETIRALGHFEYTLYTDGSATAGAYRGGSAAVVTAGPPEAPEEVDTLKLRGAVRTSSFETEVGAICEALGWIVEGDRAGRFLVCSDSMSALAALRARPKPGDYGPLARARELLRRVTGEVVFQWVPGHCGLLGNEVADQAAREATLPPEEGGPAQRPLPVSFRAVKALIREKIRDPKPTHARTRLVYAKALQRGGRTRKEEVTLARLRSGHSWLLAAYRSRVTQRRPPELREDSVCSRCFLEEETLQHFLQECPATAAARVSCLGSAAPSLSILCKRPGRVIAYLERLELI